MLLKLAEFRNHLDNFIKWGFLGPFPKHLTHRSGMAPKSHHFNQHSWSVLMVKQAFHNPDSCRQIIFFSLSLNFPVSGMRTFHKDHLWELFPIQAINIFSLGMVWVPALRRITSEPCASAFNWNTGAHLLRAQCEAWRGSGTPCCSSLQESHSILSVTYSPLHNCKSQPTVCPWAGMSRKCLVL